MWWLVPVGAVGAVAAIYSYFSSKERDAAERWARDRERVERTIEEHRHNIEANIAAAKASLDFKFLLDLHYSSFRVADEAYRLKSDASATLDTMGRMLDDARTRRDELHLQLRGDLSSSERNALRSEIQMLNELRSSVRPRFQQVLDEKRVFASELSRLNEQTRALKVAIRDRCGQRGRDWYARLEERKRARR
jgi:hypothetical protein